MELIKSNNFEYSYNLELTKRELVELLRFYFETGWIPRDGGYDIIQDFIWKLKIEMDNIYPSWQPNDLRKICKEWSDEGIC